MDYVVLADDAAASVTAVPPREMDAMVVNAAATRGVTRMVPNSGETTSVTYDQGPLLVDVLTAGGAHRTSVTITNES